MIDKKNLVALLTLVVLGSLDFADIHWKAQVVDLQNLDKNEWILGEKETALDFLKERGYDCSISKTMEFSQQKRVGKSVVCLQGGMSMASAVFCSPTMPDSQQLLFVLGQKAVEYSLRLECHSW